MPMRTLTRKNLKKKCDEAWSAAIRSKGYCEVCGKTDNLQAHHIVGRINYSLRYDLKNGICLCPGCHTFGRNSAHNNPIHFLEWFKSTRPDDYEYLKQKKNEIAKYLDYEEILKGLKEEYAQLKAGRR